jgi:TonB-dependent receptor
MNRKKHLPLLLGCLAFALVPVPEVPAQESPATESVKRATGTISGRVQNVVNGQYLVNARVSVKGTNLEAFTDETGIFHLTQVPSGPAVIEVFYTGLDPESLAVEVPVGGVVNQQVLLSNERRYGSGEKVTVLDAFVVEASSETSAEALAVNEQRFAPNIKNVVAADAFGDISEGNVGEFMKYMPGITADFADPDIVSLSVRGLDSNLTQVTSDGAQVASAHYGGSTRVFQFNQVSINNISRIELTKVPTPADPADSLGGIINMISKSAFDRKNARLDYRLFLTGSHGGLTLKKLPDGFDQNRRRVMPSADFTYTLPVNNNLGFVFSGITSSRFDERHVIARTYNATLANSNASYSNPFLQSFTVQELPRYTYRTSGSIKVDWRATPNSVLSASFQHNKFKSTRAMNQLLVNVGGNAVPTAGGTPLDFGPDYTHGATGRGAMTMNGQFYKIRGETDLGSVRYRFDNGDWQIKAGASQSSSKTRFTDTEDGTFYNTTVQLFGAAGFVGSAFTINFDNLPTRGGGTLEILDKNKEPVDIGDLKAYRMTASSSQPRDVTDKVEAMNVSVRRRFNQLPFPLAIEGGAAQRTQKRDTRLQQLTWDYAGEDGKATTWESPAAYIGDPRTRNIGFGFTNIPWVSNTAIYTAWQETPGLFTQTVARQVTQEKYRITNSEAFEETVSAGYLELDLRLLKNRLRILTGVRYEKTLGKGQGALTEPNGVYLRNADGSFAHDANDKLIRKPEAGAVGSMEEVSQTLFERAAQAKRGYDGYYPSVHVTYNFTENLLLRAAYAGTYGRPNFNQIIPRATINDLDVDDSDPDALLGTISLRNPALRPWTADNYDVSLEYYTKSGGVYGVGYYYKEIDGFFQSVVKVATAEDVAEWDLDPMYIGYRVTTTYNLNRGRTSGVEFNFKQSLDRLGAWGRHFDVFANASFFEAISGLRGRTINSGVTFRMKPVTINAKMNHRTGRRGAKVAALGPDAYEYEGTRTTVDLSLSVALTGRLSLFANGSNIFNNYPSAERYGSETPEYAKFFREQQFGATYAIGIKGVF